MRWVSLGYFSGSPAAMAADAAIVIAPAPIESIRISIVILLVLGSELRRLRRLVRVTGQGRCHVESIEIQERLP